MFDVAVDVRAGSPTKHAWHSVELSAEDGRAFYIPAGFAHGFQMLTDGVEAHCQMGRRYAPEATRGVRFDDPAFGIDWPASAGERTISERDPSGPDFSPDLHRTMQIGPPSGRRGRTARGRTARGRSAATQHRDELVTVGPQRL